MFTVSPLFAISSLYINLIVSTSVYDGNNIYNIFIGVAEAKSIQGSMQTEGRLRSDEAADFEPG